MLELEVLVHLAGGEVMALLVVAFGQGEDDEERSSKDDTADGSDGLGKEIDDGGGEQDEEDRDESQREFSLSDADVKRDLPAAFAVVLPTEDEHGERVEGEAPDDAEGVGFAEHDNVAAGDDDGKELESNDEIDDAIAGSKATLRFTEPVGEDAVFGDAHEDAGGAYDGGVDGSAEDEEADEHDENAEGDAQCDGADHVHGHAGDEVVAIDRDADGIGDEHDGEHGADASKDEAIDGDDDGGALEIFELRVLDLAIDLSEGLFAAHGQDGVAKGHEHAEEAEGAHEAGVFEEAEGVVAEVQVAGGGERRQMGSGVEDGEEAPGEQNYHHDGGDLHDLEGFVAGLFNTLGVLTPEVDGDDYGDDGGGSVDGELAGLSVEVGGEATHPMMRGTEAEDFVEEADDVLAGGDA